MRLAALLFFVMTASPALALVAGTGVPTETVGYGIMKGLAHPVAGFEHLLFVLAAGAAAALAGQALPGILSWVAGMTAASLVILQSGDLPVQQVLGGGALVLIGGLIASGRRPSVPRLAIVFFLGGVLQGAIFSAGILGPLTTPGPAGLAGYLAGFAATQALIACTAALLAAGVRPLSVRLASAAMLSAGVLLCFEMAEAALAG